jgi:hypothetical protein
VTEQRVETLPWSRERKMATGCFFWSQLGLLAFVRGIRILAFAFIITGALAFALALVLGGSHKTIL